MRMPEGTAVGLKAQPEASPEPRSRAHLDIFLEKVDCKDRSDSPDKFKQSVAPDNRLGHQEGETSSEEEEEDEEGVPIQEAPEDWQPRDFKSMLDYRESCSHSESDQEDDSADSQDDDVVCKGPERNRRSLHHATPYSSQQGVYTHSNHFCGGSLYLSQSTQSSQFNNFNITQIETKNETDEDYQFLQNLLSNMTPVERQAVDSNFEELMKTKEMKDLFSTMDITDKEIPSDQILPPNQWKSPARDIPPPPCPKSKDVRAWSQGGPFIQTSPPPLVLDEDSGYNSTSPLSSINSPRPLSTCSSDPLSPYPEMPAGPAASALQREHFIHRNIHPVHPFHVRPIAPDSAIIHEQQMTASAESRITKRLNNTQLEIEWIRVLQDDAFFHIPSDKDDTKLLKHLKSPNQGKFFYEILHCFLERIKNHSDKKQSLEYLKFHNRLGESALRISLFKLADSSLITRYIVETLAFLGDDVHQMHLNGIPLIHFLVEQGDKAAEAVAELLNTKKEGNMLLFDANKKNSVLETPLHIAAKVHVPGRLSTLALVKLLINHNASILMEDSNGMTPVHLAVKYSCDRMLIKALLSNAMCLAKVSDAKDYMGDTAMHIAASRNDLPIKCQAQVMKQLKDSNWSLKTKNDFDKTPVALLADERKQEVLDYINRK